MDFLNTLENNSILLIPNNIKEKVLFYLDETNTLKSIKIMTFNDFKKGLLFDYTNETINHVMKSNHVNYGVAKDYINNLYYLEDKEYDNNKLITLKNLYKELDDNNLLIKDVLFKNLIKSKSKIYVYGFDYINKFNKYLLSLVKDIIDIEYLDKEVNSYNHDVYEFKTMEDEVVYVFETISDLIMNNVPINKIYITNYSDEYYFTFRRLLKEYNLPIFIKSETNIYSTAIGSFFLNNLDNNLDKLIEKIKDKFNYEENIYNQNVINRLISLLNNYYWTTNILDVKDLLIEEMKRTNISSMHFENEITTTSIIDNSFDEDEYVFLLGFNLGSIPKLKKDEDYISDDIKPEFLENTNEYNKAIKDTYMNAIKSIKNLYITYKLSTPFNSYSPSFLINDESLNVISMNNIISKYSDNYNKLLLAKKIDSLIKFNEYSDELEVLYNNYSIDYKSYDNKFKGINVNHLLEDINDKINFSYSNISEYYSCPFKFYVNRILNINEYESTLDAFIGSLFHKVLEEHLKDETDIDTIYDKYIEDNKDKIEMNEMTKYFLDILKEEIHFIVDTIKEQYKHSSHTDQLFEHKVEININDKINTKIKGIVDKVLSINNYLLIVDYKTSNKEIDKDLFEFGIGIQLPMYLYLLKQINPDYEIAGIYLQHILNLKQDYDKDKNYIEEKKKKLKLSGITFNNISLISKFDDTYESSEVIKSLKVNKDGELYNYKNILDEDERNELTDLMERLIMTLIGRVCDADFAINPIKINNKVDGCDYCSYKDICYRKFKDFNIQVIKKDGGDLDE